MFVNPIHRRTPTRYIPRDEKHVSECQETCKERGNALTNVFVAKASTKPQFLYGTPTGK